MLKTLSILYKVDEVGITLLFSVYMGGMWSLEVLGNLPRFASKCMLGSVPEFSFSDSKPHVPNLSIKLPPKESDKGPQFPHLSKGELGSKCSSISSINML